MTVDISGGSLAVRAYYHTCLSLPVSGTKPIVANAWFEIVQGQHGASSTNTFLPISRPSFLTELIGSLALARRPDLPLLAPRRELLGTVNLLDVEWPLHPPSG